MNDYRIVILVLLLKRLLRICPKLYLAEITKICPKIFSAKLFVQNFIRRKFLFLMHRNNRTKRSLGSSRSFSKLLGEWDDRSDYIETLLNEINEHLNVTFLIVLEETAYIR